VPIVWRQGIFSGTRGNDLREFDEGGLFCIGWDGMARLGMAWVGQVRTGRMEHDTWHRCIRWHALHTFISHGMTGYERDGFWHLSL
jgi:hypothetical protein